MKVFVILWLFNCGSVNAKKLEKVQLQAARIVTGALQPTQLEQLYKETGGGISKRIVNCSNEFVK